LSTGTPWTVLVVALLLAGAACCFLARVIMHTRRRAEELLRELRATDAVLRRAAAGEELTAPSDRESSGEE